jgi:arylsulfatase A
LTPNPFFIIFSQSFSIMLGVYWRSFAVPILISNKGASMPSLSRRTFLHLAGMAALGTSLMHCSTKERKPNILLILTDDQGWGDIHSHGNAVLDTPTLDRLAASGARFDRFYVSPVCAPTRASLLTGRYYLRTHVHGVTRGQETMYSEEVTIAEMLKKAGYATGCFGKWHNGAHYPYHPNGQGFDEFIGFCAGHWNNYIDTHLEHNGRRIETKGYIADVLTDHALRFMEKNRSRPFLCYVPYNPPHSPFQVPDAYFDKYKSQGLDDTLASVYAMCENLDDNIARLLNKLDQLELTNDTIVIFITDNGPNTERYNGGMRGRKGSIHEGGMRVPCFISWPGEIEAGQVIEPISAHIDILPTLAELTGVRVPSEPELDGTSLVPLLKKSSKSWPERKLFQHWGGRGAVRTPRYRLTLEGDRIGLYDMIEDPSETENIADERPDITKSLGAAYQDWYKEVTQRGYEPLPIPVGYDEWPRVEMPGHEAYLSKEAGQGISYVGKSGWANDWVTHWTDIDAYPFWEIEVVKEADYEVTLKYACPPENVGTRIEVRAGAHRLTGEIRNAFIPERIESPDRVPRKEVYEQTWGRLDMGRLHLPKGRYTLVVRALSRPGKTVMDLKAVILAKKI